MNKCCHLEISLDLEFTSTRGNNVLAIQLPIITHLRKGALKTFGKEMVKKSLTRSFNYNYVCETVQATSDLLKRVLVETEFLKARFGHS